MNIDEYFMNIALSEAKKAYDKNEIPVGAVIVENGKIIAKAFNKKNSTKVVCNHAEMIAIIKACHVNKDWRLNECTIYITMEPCPMCASAIQQARIKRVVYGCSSNNIENSKLINDILNNSAEIENGILENECSSLIRKFFNGIR